MTSTQWAAWPKDPLELAAAQGGNALHEAIRGRHEEVMVNLLENADTSVDAKGERDETPLHVALQSTPLHRVAMRTCGLLAFDERDRETDIWCERAVQLLLRKGADPNVMGSWGTPLHYACMFQNLGATKALLEAGADLNTRVRLRVSGVGDPRSVLDAAAGGSTADIVRELIGHGADVTAAGPGEVTPLHSAGDSHFAEVADVLIEAGANIEARDAHNRTPLHVAAGNLNLTMVRAFLKHGAKVNDLSAIARTPLHEAAFTTVSQPLSSLHAAGVVDLLLRSGADETLVDDGGRTAGDLANQEVRERMIVGVRVRVRVRELLANARANKAWRRRGCWPLCRAHPDRLQEDLLRPDNTRTDGSQRQSAPSSFRASSVQAEVDLQSNGGGWADAAVWVLGLGEEAIFRTIVRYL